MAVRIKLLQVAFGLVLTVVIASSYFLLGASRLEEEFLNAVQSFKIPPSVSTIRLSWPDTFEGRLVERFWDLRNESSNGSLTEPLFNNATQFQPYLWSHGEYFPNGRREGDRVIAQLVWAMELGRNLTPFRGAVPPKTIYLPDQFEWWFVNWSDPHTLEDQDCPGYPGIVKNCIFTQNSGQLFDLIVLGPSYLEQNGRNRKQLRFSYQLESPVHSDVTIARHDMMATYWAGSDLATPNAKWLYYDPSVKFIPPGRSYSQGKTKMAAMFASNCFPMNNRMNYVTELQKYIQVDVFGQCGDKVCSRDESKRCFQMLSEDYYFYLAFENSNCRDYITEKFFYTALSNDVVPVVLGAHPDDYARAAPEKSYLHVEDFQSPKELASQLKMLSASPDEYNSYFGWKKTGEFVGLAFFCRLCGLAHYADLVPPQPRSHRKSYGKCLPSGHWYWTRS